MRVTSVVCPFCGALCDDIEIEVEGDVIKGVKRGCALSKSFFLSHAEDLSHPLVEGREVELEEAVEEWTSTAILPAPRSTSAARSDRKTIGVIRSPAAR
ncbi:hypothetical protein [Candidatus Hakubella thermalkaliphila]|uniref:hypothetical protein n=1 Tax=Candidatus Hakubella thermalkaliphila TaxID=2754717 RepID=UPI001592E80B|nr:hypothetical protein [Candidatus Hakubella thermalkaliphila]